MLHKTESSPPAFFEAKSHALWLHKTNMKKLPGLTSFNHLIEQVIRDCLNEGLTGTGCRLLWRITMTKQGFLHQTVHYPAQVVREAKENRLEKKQKRREPLALAKVTMKMVMLRGRS
ncbi:hypothetical protein OIU74_010892 [Salix koriyanagi]|uniref:Uncharacterized protein n=1 Tax=Salix koriyanagi TaxID=2511006 RepID=A0A9Q0TE00_9ROSI|nr:hypothetical protein OIU74_010892 [Salix koriyanagi]